MASDSAAESSRDLLISEASLLVKADQKRRRSKSPRVADAMSYSMNGMTLGCRSSSQSYVLAVGHLGRARPSAGLTKKGRIAAPFERSYSRLVSNVAQSQQQSTDSGKIQRKREVKVKLLAELFLHRSRVCTFAAADRDEDFCICRMIPRLSLSPCCALFCLGLRVELF